MIDWRTRIEGELGAQPAPTIKGSGVQVEAVLRLLRDGWTIERVVERFPGLSAEDIRACFDYAVALLEHQRFHAEIRRRIEADKADPESAIPHDEVIRDLLAALAVDEE